MHARLPAASVPDWLAKLYPFGPRTFLTRGGAAMNYVDEGTPTDEAVLLLHGNPTWSFFYRNVVQTLATNRRCIAPDHVGMGLSDKPANYDYSLASRIDDIEALVDSLGLRRVHLVVHDWGGAIGFGLAARRPGLIGRIVILNTAAFVSHRLPWRIALCRVPAFGPFLVRGLNGFAGPAASMAMHRRSLTAEEKQAYLWPYGSWNDRVAVNAFVQDIPMRASHASRPTLEAIERALGQFSDRPILIVWGGCDFCFNDHFLQRWRKIFPRARVERIADAGHYVLEDAREDAVPLVTRFLSQP